MTIGDEADAHYINRDHISFLTFSTDVAEILTMFGLRIIINGSARQIAQLRGELVEDVSSNFCPLQKEQ